MIKIFTQIFVSLAVAFQFASARLIFAQTSVEPLVLTSSAGHGETKTISFTPEEFKSRLIAKPRLWWPMNKTSHFCVISRLNCKRKDDFNTCIATVKNPSKNLAFLVWLRLQQADTNKPVPPAFYEDNFFSLLPGESRTLKIEFANATAEMKKTKLIVDGWNIIRSESRL